MSFVDQVNGIKEKVLKSNIYAKPIEDVMNRAKNYKAEKTVDEILKANDKEEMTL